MTFKTFHWMDCDSTHSQKPSCHCKWMSLCLLTLWHSKVYTFILIRVGDKALIFRWVIIDWAGCELAKTDHIYIDPEITNHGLKRSLWPWHIPSLMWNPPGPKCWLPCFACGPDERLSADTWVMAIAEMTDWSGLTCLWLVNILPNWPLIGWDQVWYSQHFSPHNVQ